jgi:hypothetical protein
MQSKVGTTDEHYTIEEFAADLLAQIESDMTTDDNDFHDFKDGYAPCLVLAMCSVLQEISTRRSAGINSEHVEEVLSFYKELAYYCKEASRLCRTTPDESDSMADYCEWSYQLSRSKARLFTDEHAFWPEQKSFEEYCDDDADNYDPEYEIRIPFRELMHLAFNYISHSTSL